MILQKIFDNKIVAILRGVPTENIVDTVTALYDGGIRLVEVTFNQSGDLHDTAKSIEIISNKFENKITVGAGTVLTLQQLKLAVTSGARYIISPNCDTNIIAKTKKYALVSIPGVITPTEAVLAHKSGADIVKIFPADSLGAKYIKNILAPLSHIRIMAVGGVNENNLQDFFNAGACAVGIGGNIVNLADIKTAQYQKITEKALAYTSQLGI